nr:uncharacterized protein LOC129167792 [Nothobranchius furzeri]
MPFLTAAILFGTFINSAVRKTCEYFFEERESEGLDLELDDLQSDFDFSIRLSQATSNLDREINECIPHDGIISETPDSNRETSYIPKHSGNDSHQETETHLIDSEGQRKIVLPLLEAVESEDFSYTSSHQAVRSMYITSNNSLEKNESQILALSENAFEESDEYFSGTSEESIAPFDSQGNSCELSSSDENTSETTQQFIASQEKLGEDGAEILLVSMGRADYMSETSKYDTNLFRKRDVIELLPLDQCEMQDFCISKDNFGPVVDEMSLAQDDSNGDTCLFDPQNGHLKLFSFDANVAETRGTSLTSRENLVDNETRVLFASEGDEESFEQGFDDFERFSFGESNFQDDVLHLQETLGLTKTESVVSRDGLGGEEAETSDSDYTDDVYVFSEDDTGGLLASHKRFVGTEAETLASKFSDTEMNLFDPENNRLRKLSFDASVAETRGMSLASQENLVKNETEVLLASEHGQDSFGQENNDFEQLSFGESNFQDVVLYLHEILGLTKTESVISRDGLGGEGAETSDSDYTDDVYVSSDDAGAETLASDVRDIDENWFYSEDDINESLSFDGSVTDAEISLASQENSAEDEAVLLASQSVEDYKSVTAAEDGTDLRGWECNDLDILSDCGIAPKYLLLIKQVIEEVKAKAIASDASDDEFAACSQVFSEDGAEPSLALVESGHRTLAIPEDDSHDGSATKTNQMSLAPREKLVSDKVSEEVDYHKSVATKGANTGVCTWECNDFEILSQCGIKPKYLLHIKKAIEHVEAKSLASDVSDKDYLVRSVVDS